MELGYHHFNLFRKKNNMFEVPPFFWIIASCPVLNSSNAPSSTSHSFEFCPWRNATRRRGGMDCRPQVTEVQELGSKGCSKQIKATKCHWTSASSKLCGTASTCIVGFCDSLDHCWERFGKSWAQKLDYLYGEICEIKPCWSCWWIPCFLLGLTTLPA